jgi:hypothetical protein
VISEQADLMGAVSDFLECPLFPCKIIQAKKNGEFRQKTGTNYIREKSSLLDEKLNYCGTSL